MVSRKMREIFEDIKKRNFSAPALRARHVISSDPTPPESAPLNKGGGSGHYHEFYAVTRPPRHSAPNRGGGVTHFF